MRYISLRMRCSQKLRVQENVKAEAQKRKGIRHIVTAEVDTIQLDVERQNPTLSSFLKLPDSLPPRL